MQVKISALKTPKGRPQSSHASPSVSYFARSTILPLPGEIRDTRKEDGTSMGDKEVTGESNITALLSSAPYDQWILIHSSGWCPPARYKHAAEVVQDKLYVVGGSRNGRYLSDIQVLDLRTFKWSTISPKLDPKSSNLENITSEETFPASAGHSLVKWENKLLIVTGYSKEPLDTVTVLSIDLETHYYSVVPTNGKIPTARGGQSVTLVGSKLVMFGGEDRRRRLLNDLHILDLKTMTWDIVEAKKTYPAPRFDHIAAVHADQYLLIFGGSSHSTCFNDLHLLDLHSKCVGFLGRILSIDLETHYYSVVPTNGKIPTARGGQSVTLVGSKLVMFGGEDRRRRLLNDLHILDLKTMTWDIVEAKKTYPAPRFDHIAAVHADQYLLIFGGSSHSTCFNDLHLLDLHSMEWSRPETQGAYVTPRGGHAGTTVDENWYIVGGGDNQSGATETIVLNTSKFVWSVTTSVKQRDPLASECGLFQSYLSCKVDFYALIENCGSTMSTAKKVLLLNDNDSDNQKALSYKQNCIHIRGKEGEKPKAQIAVMQNRLESLRSVEHELEVLRHQKSQMEQDMAAAQRKRSGGVWQWMTSSAQNFED
ncbi:acyl-CoA-binding domain-containing protein 4 [Cocos nucifera]|uniref:Acyl-CoA-binding domain-containing protein 4 n=1 Tax=Cocos nucifera TaxID=13894 RepID=A0A8K0IKL0_COCNU|nr:acyl-CoA-binding domain-containing protein 4 [Cocos nucifera]